MGVWNFMDRVISAILVTYSSPSSWKLKNQGDPFLSSLLPSLFLLSLTLSFPSLFPFHPTMSSNFVSSCDGDLLSCSLCLFLSFRSGISQPVLLSWSRRQSSCSKQEQESYRWQTSGNASIFWIDSDWKTGRKHSWDHEGTQMWGAWCESVWLHSPRMEKAQPHIQVTLLPAYSPLIQRNIM